MRGRLLLNHSVHGSAIPLNSGEGEHRDETRLALENVRSSQPALGQRGKPSPYRRPVLYRGMIKGLMMMMMIIMT